MPYPWVPQVVSSVRIHWLNIISPSYLREQVPNIFVPRGILESSGQINICTPNNTQNTFNFSANHKIQKYVASQGKVINHIVGFEVLTSVVMKSSIFWDITSCSPLKFSRPLLASYFTLISCLGCTSTVKMEATFSSETAVDIHGTTRRNTPEDRTLH
jgi:hypothetical protein